MSALEAGSADTAARVAAATALSWSRVKGPMDAAGAVAARPEGPVGANAGAPASSCSTLQRTGGDGNKSTALLDDPYVH